MSISSISSISSLSSLSSSFSYIPWGAIFIVANKKDADPDVVYTFYLNLINLLPNINDIQRSWEFMDEYPIEQYINSGKLPYWTYLWKKHMGGSVPSLEQIQKDYSTPNKTKWGNAFWRMIHTISKHLPKTLNEETAETMVSFVYCIQKLLPCKKCKGHMAEHLIVYPIENAISKEKGLDVFVWSVVFHNAVNKSLDKPAVKLEDAYLLY